MGRRLDPTTERRLRRAIQEGRDTQEGLASRYGVSQSTVSILARDLTRPADTGRPRWYQTEEEVRENNSRLSREFYQRRPKKTVGR